MIKVVTAEQMRAKDRFTIEDIGVPSVILMENAGAAAFRIILKALEKVKDPMVYVLCGKGNNGGDGFVIARHLWNEGVYVRVFCIEAEDKLFADAATNYRILKNMKIPMEVVTNIEDIHELESAPPDILVDALLGTGIKGAVEGIAREVIDFINMNVETTIVSVDIPSGLDASSAAVAGSAIRADLTVTMGLPKHCHVLYPARYHVGELFIADIGIPPSVLSEDDVEVNMLENDDIVLPFRYADSHKYEYGKVAVLAGSKGYTGAAVLCASAAMRMGAGLVILGVPESINPTLEGKLTETVTRPLPETSDQTIGKKSLPAIKDLVEWCDVLAIGPGLGRSEEVQNTILEVLKYCDKPTVIDADALLALANNPQILKDEAHPNWILTPHMGEFLRFFPEENRDSVAINRIALAQKFVQQYGVHLLLKGAPALVAMLDQRIYLNPTGNSGLASGGTGDVLTGLTAGLLAQGFNPDEAAYTANFVHGYTADYIIRKETPHTLIAGDILKFLGKAMNELLS